MLTMNTDKDRIKAQAFEHIKCFSDHLERFHTAGMFEPRQYAGPANTLKRIAPLADSAFVSIHLYTAADRISDASEWLDRLSEHRRIADELAAKYQTGGYFTIEGKAL